MNRLTTPFMYLRVRHSLKRWYDVLYPLLFAAGLGTVLVCMPLRFNVLGERGLVETFNGLLSILIGFYIAALAAVATFDRPGMDAIMRGEAATLRLPGRVEPLALTRRMYLCLLFGYLTLVALIAFIVFSLANVVFSNMSPPPAGQELDAFRLTRAAFIYVYCFTLGHILSHSLLGVHYLAWRAVIVEKSIVEDH